jgi:hypothetical protein
VRAEIFRLLFGLDEKELPLRLECCSIAAPSKPCLRSLGQGIKPKPIIWMSVGKRGTSWNMTKWGALPKMKQQN